MRNLHKIKRLRHSVLLIGIFLFSHPFFLVAYVPQLNNPPVDTALAEQYIRQAKTASPDSLYYYYKQALSIYQTAKKETTDSIVWNRYFEVGNLWCQSLKDKQKAIEQFDVFRKEAIEKFGAESFTVAENHYYQGLAFSDSRKYEAAIEQFQIALNIYEAIKNVAGLIKGNNSLGYIFQRRANHYKADKHYRLALKHSLATYGQMHKKTADFLHRIGRNYFVQGQYKKAKATLDTLIKIETTILDSNDSKIGSSYILIGNVHFKQAAYNEAINYYEKAKVIYLQDSIKYIKNIASCIGNIGAANIEKGNFEKANALYIEAAELKKKHYGENSVSLAYTYYNIGAGFAEQGDFQSALDYFFKSVRIIRKSSGEDHPDVAYVYNGIGQIYSRTGDWEEANNYYQQALAIREKTRTTDHPETAKDYDRIGGVYQEKGDLIAAKAAYEKALAIRQKAFEPDHKIFADSYTNLASIYMSNKELNKAENLIKKALAIQEKNFEPYHYSIASTYLQLANVAKLRGDLRKALDYYQIAMIRFVPEFESLHLRDNPELTGSFSHKTKITDILYRKGTTLKQYYLQQPDSIQFLKFSFNTLQTSSQIADLNRQGFGSDYSKKAFLNNAFLVYKKLVNVGALLAKQPNSNITQDTLFALMEKNKSILLLESIKDESAKEFAGVPVAFINQENQLKKQIAYFENQLVGRKERGVPPTDNRLMELEEKVFQLRQKHQDLVQQLEAKHPKYHQLKYESEAASIVDIQQYLPHDSAALLQYTLSPSQLYVMAITSTAIFQHQQAVDSTFFKQLAAVKQFLNTNPTQQSKEVQIAERQQYIQKAHNLFQQILAPVLAKMGTINELVIIPDAELNYLPFEALILALPASSNPAFDQLEYVLNQYTINYEYSATLWWQNQQNQDNSSQLFAGFAPEYEGIELLASRSSNALGLSGRSVAFQPLKYNQTEVEELAESLSGKRVLGDAATESAFKAQASNYGILHLAMHAYVNDKNPNYSHLVFAEEKDSTEDRFLYAYELYNMQLNADLAVLSACETGSGQLQRGEGVMSLSRAFKYAGVPNIVMSFWKADDFYTKNMMTQFYQFLKSGSPKNKALQQAKKVQIAAAKDNKEAAHPYYWANFVLVGDAEPIQFGTQFPWINWLIGGLLLIISGFVFAKRKTF